MAYEAVYMLQYLPVYLAFLFVVTLLRKFCIAANHGSGVRALLLHLVKLKYIVTIEFTSINILSILLVYKHIRVMKC
jgi:hypothetical protein